MPATAAVAAGGTTGSSVASSFLSALGSFSMLVGLSLAMPAAMEAADMAPLSV